MCGIPASSLVLRRAAPGELPQFEVVGQRQARGHLPRLVREDRGQGGLDGLAGHDLIVLIDEDDLERLHSVERCDAGVLDLHDHGGLHLVVRHRRAGLLQRVAMAALAALARVSSPPMGEFCQPSPSPCFFSLGMKCQLVLSRVA